MLKNDVFILDEEIHIGGLGAQKEYLFNAVISMAVDNSENIYVLVNDCQIKIFNKNGKYIKSFGRKGQGPGEFEMPSSISLISKRNEIVVFGMNRRLSFFSLEGNFLRQIFLKDFWPMQVICDSIGNIVAIEGSSDPSVPYFKLKKLRSDMTLIATLATFPAPFKGKTIIPFSPVAYFQIDDIDRILYAYPKDYEIIFYGTDNKIEKKIVRKYDPLEISKEERGEKLKYFPKDIKVEFPKYHSAFQRFIVGDDGYIFVEIWEKAKDGKRSIFDVYDDIGKYIGQTKLYPDPKIIKKQRLYSLEEDADGFQVIKKYDIKWKKSY